MFRLNLTDETFETISEAEEALYNWCEDNQDELLDESYPEGIRIFGMYYSASEILKKCDPTAYRCITSDLMDSYYDEIEELEEDGE